MVVVMLILFRLIKMVRSWGQVFGWLHIVVEVAGQPVVLYRKDAIGLFCAIQSKTKFTQLKRNLDGHCTPA